MYQFNMVLTSTVIKKMDFKLIKLLQYHNMKVDIDCPYIVRRNGGELTFKMITFGPKKLFLLLLEHTQL